MAWWAIVIILIFTVLMVVMGGWLFYLNQILLLNSNLDQTFYTFEVQSSTESQNAQSVSAPIKCPSGRSAMVIDAWYEVYDPNFQCTASPTQGAPAVNEDGTGFVTTISKDACDSGDCYDNVWKYTSSGGGAMKNMLCQYDSAGNPLKDSVAGSMYALGYTANYINGQESTTIYGDPNGNFGPLPWPGDLKHTEGSLPIGGQYESGSNNSMTTGYQGPLGHGIYVCVLDD